MSYQINLQNKVALVTGAAGLLGFHHCNALLSAGATVVATDSNSLLLDSTVSRLLKKYPSDLIIPLVMDVTSQDSIDVASTHLQAIERTPAILINNAAYNPKVTSDLSDLNTNRLETFPLDQWEKEVSVGLTGAFLCAQTFGTLMATSGQGGVIINIASDLSVIAPDQRLYSIPTLDKCQQPVKPVTYSVIKTALLGLTRYLATYWSAEGVRCNALSPGGVLHNQNPEFVDRVTSRIPIGRMAFPNEYESAVVFLCSDSSSYMNGHNLVMDGGRSIW